MSKPDFPGFRPRISTRWFRRWKGDSKISPLPVPYISQSGKFTTHVLGTWTTYPETWFVSVVSTVVSRLEKIFRTRCKAVRYRPTRGDYTLLVTAATLHVYSHSHYIFDRILANLRPGRLGVARRLSSYYCARLGAPFRFVLNQAQFIASWLSFRSNWIRDKPIEFDEKCFRSFLLYCSFRRERKGKVTWKIQISPYKGAVDWSTVADFIA